MTHKGRGYTLRSVRIEGIRKGRGRIPGSGRFEHEGRAYTLRSGKFEGTNNEGNGTRRAVEDLFSGKGGISEASLTQDRPCPGVYSGSQDERITRIEREGRMNLGPTMYRTYSHPGPQFLEPPNHIVYQARPSRAKAATLALNSTGDIVRSVFRSTHKDSR